MTESEILRRPEYLHVVLNHLTIYGVMLSLFSQLRPKSAFFEGGSARRAAWRAAPSCETGCSLDLDSSQARVTP
jgi:hypothetical protein